MNAGRIISLGIGAVYVLILWLAGDLSEGFKGGLGVALILGLPCIWYGDELGGILGFQITSTTPGSFVKFIGWVFLLALPVLGHIVQICVYD